MSPFNYVGVKLRTRRPTSMISSEASAEDKPLFMTSKPVKEGRRSLSPIEKPSPKKVKRVSASSFKSLDDPAPENMAWDIINREISEWQNICQTGRPSWWSSIPKWTQIGARSTWQEEVLAIPPWRMTVDHGRRRGQRYDEQRRAVTDSYISDNRNVQDLAHLIAVQLLSACFTLRPDHMADIKSSAYHCFDTLDSNDIPNSHMISSLRMHTEARYSPSFGHQAPNTSPVYRWAGAYDGPSPSRSRQQSSNHLSKDVDESGKNMSSGRKLHRTSHVTEDSATHGSTDSPSGPLGKYGAGSLLPTEEMMSYFRRKRDRIADQVAQRPRPPDRTIRTCPSSPGAMDFQLPGEGPINSAVFHESRFDGSHSCREKSRHDRSSRLSLEAITRSESHPVYEQPVKELVVKRWQTLRQRFGHSLSNGSPDLASSGAHFLSSLFTFSNSKPGETSSGNLNINSNAKERRRQARERGDIHSSIDSGIHHGTPDSAVGSGSASPSNLDYLSTHSELKERSEVTRLEDLRMNSGKSATISLCIDAPSLAASLAIPKPPLTVVSSLNSRPEPVPHPGSLAVIARPPPVITSFSSRQQSRRGQRRSMLSEVYTHEEAGDVPNTLGEVNKSVVCPRDGSDPGTCTVQPSVDLHPNSNGEKLAAESSLRGVELDPKDSLFLFGLYGPDPQRRAMVRTSTTGTQIFSPGEQELDVDGLPMESTAETWGDQHPGKRIKERSFL